MDGGPRTQKPQRLFAALHEAEPEPGVLPRAVRLPARPPPEELVGRIPSGGTA